MRRSWIAITVISVVLVIAAPVGAAKRDCSTYPQGHPQACESDPGDPPPTDDSPMAGTTCAYLGEWGEPVTHDFKITATGRNTSYCIDVIAGEGEWTVTTEIESGSARMLLFIPRDSIAGGDSCGGYEFRSNNIPATFSGMIPGPYVNSCGLNFAEWVDVLDSETNQTEMTYIDTIEEGIQSPLAFQIDVAGSKDLEMTLIVDLPVVDNVPINVTPLETMP